MARADVVEVGHSLKDGYTLHIAKASRFRLAVTAVADYLCAMTGHHFCHRFGQVANWEDDARVDRLTIPITKEQANVAMHDKRAFSYLEDEDIYITKGRGC